MKPEQLRLAWITCSVSAAALAAGDAAAEPPVSADRPPKEQPATPVPSAVEDAEPGVTRVSGSSTEPGGRAAAPRATAQTTLEPIPTRATLPPPEERYEDAYFAQDVLKVATSAAFAATGAFGLIAAINQPTAFGDGECADGPNPNEGSGVAGHWGCEGVSILHAGLGVATTALYVSEQVTGLAIPGDEPTYGPFHQALTYTHVGGMVLTPVVGLLAAQPTIFGEEDTTDATWPKVGRTIHIATAVITAGAYWTTTLIELLSKPQAEVASSKR